MKVELSPGESVTVTFKDCDGEITVKFGDKALTVEADMPDSDNRVGVIYREEFNILDIGLWGDIEDYFSANPEVLVFRLTIPEAYVNAPDDVFWIWLDCQEVSESGFKKIIEIDDINRDGNVLEVFPYRQRVDVDTQEKLQNSLNEFLAKYYLDDGGYSEESMADEFYNEMWREAYDRS